MVETILKFLEIFVSYPFTLLVLGLVSIFTFRRPVTDLLLKIRKGTISNVSFELDQQQKGIADQIENKVAEDVTVQAVRANPEKVIQEYNLLYKKFQFERIYNVIYGTQISALERLFDSGGVGLVGDLVPHYQKHLVLFPPPVQSTLATYLNFLNAAGLISVINFDSSGAVQLTDNGREFVEYIRKEYAMFYKGKAF